MAARAGLLESSRAPALCPERQLHLVVSSHTEVLGEKLARRPVDLLLFVVRKKHDPAEGSEHAYDVLGAQTSSPLDVPALGGGERSVADDVERVPIARKLFDHLSHSG